MNNLDVAIHEAGHATVLAALGHANRLKCINIINVDNARHYGFTKTFSNSKSAGFVEIDNSLLPIEVECPFYLAGALSQNCFTLITPSNMHNLGSDIVSLTTAFNNAGHSTYFEEVQSTVYRQLFGEPSMRDRMLTALGGDAERKPEKWETILQTGYDLAEERLRKHQDAVSELADILVVRGMLLQTDLLAFFERHGLSSA